MTWREPATPNTDRERLTAGRELLGDLVGFTLGFFTVWAGALAFDVAFLLGFARRGSTGASNAILGAAGLFAAGSLFAAAHKDRLLPWTGGLLAGLLALYCGLWSLTGSAVQHLLR